MPVTFIGIIAVSGSPVGSPTPTAIVKSVVVTPWRIILGISIS